MKEKLPINVEVLKWARTSLGLGIDDVAARIKKPASTVRAWEAGTSSPSFSQLETLAYKIYKRPIAVFFFPIVPAEESPKTEFRTMPENFRENLSPGMIKLYRKAKIYQLYLDELYEGEKPVSLLLVDKFSLNQRSDITLLTERIRQKLKISIEEQCSWESVDIALKKWRKALEENGIFVFKDAFHNDDYSGFCIYHKKYPLVYLNNSMSLSRQIFTLFHELAHLLLHSGGVDFRERRVAESFEQEYYILEMQCNRFANEFLVPPSIFQSFDLKVNEKIFADLARRFSVSREVILRNYLERGLIDNVYYRKMADKWIKEAKTHKEQSTGGHYYYTQRSYLGDSYLNLVFSKYYQDKISIENVSEYLNMNPRKITTFEHYAFS